MKISQRLILLFLLSALLPIGSVGVAAYYYTSTALETQIKSQVNSVADRQSDRIRALNNRNLEILGIFTSKVQLRLLMSQYAQQPTGALRQQIADIAQTYRRENPTLHHVTVFDMRGDIIASTETNPVNDTVKAAIEQAKTGQSQSLFELRVGLPVQLLSGRLNLPGQPLGYAVLGVHTNSLLTVVQDYAQLGHSGETYLIRPAATGQPQYILPMRFNAQAALTVPPRGRADRQALNAGTDMFLDETVDYRGQYALGAVRLISGTDWRLMTKIDKNEVLAPVYQLRNFALIIFALTAAGVTIIAWWFSRLITSPLRRFTAVVDRIRHGHLTQRVKVESQDEIGQLATAFNDMTTSLLEAQARLTASISSLPFGFAIVNLKHQIVFSNAALSRLVKRAIPTDPVQSAQTLAQISADYSSSVNILECIDDAQARRRAIEENIEFGPLFFRFMFAPIMSQIDGADQVVGSVVIMEDTTEQKAIDRSRDEFFSIASHELRTPLTAIRGNSDMILQYYPELVKDPSVKEMIDDIHNSSVRLITIVNDFLDTSRLELGKIEFKPVAFDVVQLIQETIREYDVTGSRKKLALQLEPPASSPGPVLADRDRTRQVIVNLLGNAIKFTEQGGITFRLEPAKRMLKVSITDTGKGIPMENQHLLFHKFQQAAGSILTRDDTRSMGMGLYISKLLAEGMKGKLYLAHSAAGQGATFTLELPFASESDIKKAASLATQAATPTVTQTTPVTTRRTQT